MTKSVSGQKKPTCWQILPPPIWAAYTAYVTSYQHKVTYLLRTTPSIEGQLKKIDVIVRHKYISRLDITGHLIEPTQCICRSSFDVTHALSCKKGGFITLRQNEVWDITSELFNEVCVDVRKAFFDIRVFGRFVHGHSKMAVEKCFRANENENKSSHPNQVLQMVFFNWHSLDAQLNSHGKAWSCKKKKHKKIKAYRKSP